VSGSEQIRNEVEDEKDRGEGKKDTTRRGVNTPAG
jgi:hypothetical protein